jgi:probable F420-dependent oxidoreductase
MRPFRFGLTTASGDSAREWTEKVRTIEALGYATVTVPDHFPDRLAAVPALMAAANATTTLRLGSWVFCNDFRHPAMVYKEAATIDLLSDGRFELGIGAGWLKAEYDMVGIPFDSPGVRVARMQEAVRIIKGLAGDEPFEFQGGHYRIAGLSGAPKPVQRPLPPLYIGGGGRTLLTFAAKEADIVGFGAKALPGGGLDTADISRESLRRKIGWVDRALAGSDRNPERNLLVFVFELTDDRTAAAERLAEHLPGMTVAGILDSPHVLLGSVEEMTDQLQHTRQEFGISYIVLNTGNAAQIEPFAGVVKRLAGA